MTCEVLIGAFFVSPQAAIMNANEDVVTYARILLEAGADPNAHDHFGFTPMTSLLKRGFRDGAHVDEKHAQVHDWWRYIDLNDSLQIFDTTK